MNEFDIYTLGSGYYLEKILNAIRLIIDGKESFVSIIKFSSIAAIVVLAIRAGINNDLKSAAKWFLGVTVLVGLFLTSRATIHIHDKLPDSYGGLQAPRTVENVPWGLAVIGSTTSQVGNFLAEKFDMAFAATFVSSSYQETGMLFGSKIVEDISKLSIQDPNLKAFIAKFYKRCVVPDLRMGHSRANGYTVKDLAETDDILSFLKDHSSKARMINYEAGSGSTSGSNYISCNLAAQNIATALGSEIDKRKPKLVNSFLSYFFPDKQTGDANQMFESILTSSYGIFIRSSSKEAKDILLQNVMINAIGDKSGSYSKAFGKVTTEATTQAAYYSIAQMAQKFVPIYRAVLECILYGIFPLILILMVTPIGLEVLKNYGFGFIYLQMWQPMYAILFCIAGAWGKYYASGIDGGVTFANHAKIASINAEISAIAGYMLASIPILSIFITKGLVSSMGNLASSVFYVQQSAAVQNAEQAIRGNYQVGTTQIDTHSFNTTTGNKFDDNHSWQSGMKSFSMASGAMEKQFTDGRTGIDSAPALSNLAGLAKVDWSKAVGSRYDKSISDLSSRAERYQVSSVESATAGYSKLLGFDKNFSQSSQEYQNWSKNLSSEQRESLDEARSFVEKLAENHGISQQDALKIVASANLGSKVGSSWLEMSGLIGLSGRSSAAKQESYGQAFESAHDQRFVNHLGRLESYISSSSFQEGNNSNKSVSEGIKTDFSKAKSASIQASEAIDKVKSLQESKSSFEQNSSSISQDLSNRFAEEGIKSYGAVGFENLVRSDAAQANVMLNKFIDQNLGATGQASEKENFDHKALNDKFIQQSGYIESAFQEQKNGIAHSLPDNLENHMKNTVEQKQSSQKEIMEKQENMLIRSEDGLKQEVSENINKSATRTLVDAWNPIKSKKDQ